MRDAIRGACETIALLLIFLVTLFAQDPAVRLAVPVSANEPTVLMTLADGKVIRASPNGSIILHPHLRVIYFASGFGFINKGESHYQGESGKPLYFKKLEASGEGLIPFHGSTPGADSFTALIPEDGRKRALNWPGWEQTKTSHFILPGELIPVFFGTEQFAEPPPMASDFLLELLGSFLDLEMLDHPRFRALIGQFGDEEEKDLADVHRRWNVFFGGPEPTGWYETANLRADGYSNGHYDEILWIAVKYLTQGRRAKDWNYGLRKAIAHACYGIVWSEGRYQGMPRYEKSGSDPVVGGRNNPSHAKKWLRGHQLWAALSGHPILLDALHLRMDALLKAGQVWFGYWGARIGARHLDDLYASYIWTGDKRYRDLAAELIPKHVALIDSERGYWVNRGHPPTTTPGFNAELAAVHLRWMKIGVARGHLKAVLDCAEAIWENGTVPIEGFENVRGMLYRFFGAESGLVHLTHLGYAVPMLRALAEHRPEKWRPVYLAHRQLLMDRAGGSWGYLPDKVSYRLGRGGGGHSKALKQAAGALLR